MREPSDPAGRLLRSWEANAAAWTSAVREQRIESRRVATDAAILTAVRDLEPRRVLDVGCGEGWLARALAEDGLEVVGVDASAALVAAAARLGGGTFFRLTYRELTTRGSAAVGSGFDAVVCNFSLMEDELRPLLEVLRGIARPGGTLLVQTVHPAAAGEGDSERDGWRTEAFRQFGEGFIEPMPWYFRTEASWLRLLSGSGWEVAEVREPAHPVTGDPLSLIFRSRSPAAPGAAP